MSYSRFLVNRAEVKFFSFLGGVLCILIILSILISQKVDRSNSPPVKVAANPFDIVKLTAKAAYVYDVRADKILYAKNDNTRLPLASLVKVMTAVLASDLAPPYSQITITREAVETSGDSGLQVGEIWSLKNLLDFSLTSSSNDGARAIGLALGALSDSSANSTGIEADFVRAMNVKADQIGMKNTYYANDTGLDVGPSKSGAYGTASDMGLLFSYILKNYPELMVATREPTVRVSSNIASHTARNTDLIVSNIPGLKASKTGFTDLAGGNLVVAFDPEIGHPVVISILGSTEEGRFSDMMKLVNASIQTIQDQ